MQLLPSILCATLFAFSATAEELIMIDQVGCQYCEQWTTEIGPIYPKTAEGKFAPLRRINIRDIPDDLNLKSPPAFTPTFILVQNNTELARIEGYPGEAFFWPMISQLFEENTGFIDPNL